MGMGMFNTENKYPPSRAPITPTIRSPIKPRPRPFTIRPASQPATMPIRMNQRISIGFPVRSQSMGRTLERNGVQLSCRGLQFLFKARFHLTDKRFPIADFAEPRPLPSSPAREPFGPHRLQERRIAEFLRDRFHATDQLADFLAELPALARRRADVHAAETIAGRQPLVLDRDPITPDIAGAQACALIQEAHRTDDQPTRHPPPSNHQPLC